MNDYISLINGKFTNKVSVLDRGLSYGDGLFETMSWCYLENEKNVGVEFWNRHIERIRYGCSIMKIKTPSLRILNEYKKEILNKAVSNGWNNGVLKVIISRGVGGRGYKFEKQISPSIVFLCFHSQKSNFSKNIIKVKYCKSPISENSQIAGLKHLNRLDSVMARSEWGDEYYEGILCDSKNNLIEGTMTNIFKENILFTPKITKGGIKGIMRQVVIEKSNMFFDKIKEINIKKDCLNHYDSMFLTNSVIKVLPVNFFLKKKFTLHDSLKNLIIFFEEENSKKKNLELL